MTETTTEVRAVQGGGARRVALSALILLAAYVGLSLLNDPHGFLGTDTGGKVATLVATEGHAWGDVDVGHWAAAWDPDGRVHQLIYTANLNGRYLNITSLPMVLLAKPLWAVGGYRAALLLPMLGGIAAAFGGRALARRIRPGDDGWTAFWLLGVASPLTVYALDFWEHTIGVAFMVWGMVAVWDAIERSRWWLAALGGAAFAAAFTMRTEAVVYALVAGGVLGVAVLRRSGVLTALRQGGAFLLGAGLVVVVNYRFEIWLLGAPLRSARAVGAATDAGSLWSLRAQEAWLTALSPFQGYDIATFVLAVAFAVSLVGVAWASATRRPGVLAPALAALAVALYLLRASKGLGFMPGLLATTPVAAVALALSWRSSQGRRALALALIPLPIAFATQFPGGAIPQWGGRYILTSAVVLAVAGSVERKRLEPWVRRFFGVASLLVTLFGVAFLSVRTHAIADAADVLEARPEQVLIATNGFLPREFGATYGRKHWLAPTFQSELPRAIDVARRAGVDSFALVTDPDERPPEVEGFRITGTDTVTILPGVEAAVVSYHRAG